jgi:hypothetical protein
MEFMKLRIRACRHLNDLLRTVVGDLIRLRDWRLRSGGPTTEKPRQRHCQKDKYRFFTFSPGA